MSADDLLRPITILPVEDDQDDVGYTVLTDSADVVLPAGRGQVGAPVPTSSS
jgi:hypothetical protein